VHENGAGDATAETERGLRDRDAFVRATALDAVAALKLVSLAPAVSGLLGDEDFYVRMCAATAVEQLLPKRAGDLLLPLLSDPHPRVAIQAAKSWLSLQS
jgi:HEAT repeat protein